jgi:hypothetical protein
MRAGIHDHDRFDGGEEDDSPKPARPPACVLQWHLYKEEPLPDDMPVLACDIAERFLIVYTDSNYVFDSSTNEPIDPDELGAWAYIPPVPSTEAEKESA